jgi:hypothetical protein
MRGCDGLGRASLFFAMDIHALIFEQKNIKF